MKIGVETLCPTPFRRRVQSLRESAARVIDETKKKSSTIGISTTFHHLSESIQVRLYQVSQKN